MSIRLQILVSQGLDARLRKAALRSRLSKGEWVRRAIERALVDAVSTPDPVTALAALAAPTADIDQMLAEIEAGRA
jgi:hypothetical protein